MSHAVFESLGLESVGEVVEPSGLVAHAAHSHDSEENHDQMHDEDDHCDQLEVVELGEESDDLGDAIEEESDINAAGRGTGQADSQRDLRTRQRRVSGGRHNPGAGQAPGGGGRPSSSLPPSFNAS